MQAFETSPPIQHCGVLFGTAMRLCRNEADARDLVQDVMERALRAGGSLPANANVRGWLLAILRNLFIDRTRSARRWRWAALPDDLGAPEPDKEPEWASIGMDEVRAALDEVDGRFRRAYEMYELEGRSYKEIAAALGIPVVTVGTKVLRVRRKLAAALGNRMAS
jgi:RNA polymerase sigma-70 factor (ECF subfamily)